MPGKINWFYYQKELSSIEGLENLNTSAMKSMHGMFEGCSNLKELNLSSFNTAKVRDMSEMFEGCSSLKELNLSSFNTSAVTKMWDMFRFCSGLQTLDLSSFNTSAVTNMYAMFDGCSSLKELNVSSFNTSEVTKMSFMFQGCSSLKELNVSSFNTSRVTDMSGMFAVCKGLKELNVSNFSTPTEDTKIDGMFYACSSLTTVYCDDIWEAVSDRNLFKECTQLKGAVPFDRNMTDWRMANPYVGYFTQPKPTAIERVGYNGNNATKVFTLQGKRVNGNTQHLPAGFYIVNGKKVYLGR